MELLNKGHAVMLGEWLSCEHRTGKFADDKRGVRYSDAVSHAILIGNKAFNVTQRIKTEAENQLAPVDPALKRGVQCVVVVSQMVWKEGTQIVSATAVLPHAAGAK